jgi:hypothetical protein
VEWEKDIDTFYERLKPKTVFNGQQDVAAVFNETVIPTLECIASQLRLHAKNVKVKSHKYKAYISFEDQISKRSVFGVSINMKYEVISFPSTLNATSSFPSGIRLKSRNEINKDMIISNFMNFFKSREDEIKRYERQSNEASEMDS